ncbi:hypothetical protein BKA70DRAFT_1373615 [Coprinopsis sp. MPI-PUGE-AT-0042]|nr:hypothetical protein BKA70DRAFT_1373615 [Coprinopsis sp. MPI-PUGE-AT-0042]
MAESTLREFIENQDDLVREAGLALPHQFAHCTYPLGYLRQAVYLCQTCPEQRGICSACSIACHTDHEQIELFPKRDFRCDCCTTAIAHKCSLELTGHPANERNQYGQNFCGLFCRCHRTYDAQKEREAMIQCLACEDWFHESCCNLRERPSSRAPTPSPGAHRERSATAPASTHASGDGPGENHEDDDADSEASFSGLPPPLVRASDYDSFVCGHCVRKIPILMKYAGTPGAIMVVRDSPSSEWRRIGDCTSGNEEHKEAKVDIDADDVAAGSSVGLKRKLDEELNSEDAREQKRPRKPSESANSAIPPCLAPIPNPIAAQIFQQQHDDGHGHGAGDLFLTDGFRERWCRCEDCRGSLDNNRFLVEEEETYEPPEDPDSGLSLEELGMRALSRLPRDRAIDGIEAFNKMRDGLKSFLQPFADQGKVVNEADVRDFFSSLTEDATQKTS